MMPFSSKRSFTPRKIVIEESIAHTAFAQRLVNKFKYTEKEYIDDATILLQNASTDLHKERWRGQLLLAKQRGPFLRLCPGTQKHLCCLYHNLDVAAGCDLGCSYCILQGYLKTPLVTLYCNMDDMYSELDTTLSRRSNAFFRIGTGELTDSLTFEHMTELGPEVVNYFSNKHNAIIELKSKNVHIDKLLGLKHNGRAVISWSMNSAVMRSSEEPLATSIDDRLLAATEVQQAGYKIGFHFDPMLDHPDWRDGYRETVDKIFSSIKPDNIVWISLGALRYPAPFEEVMRENHPESRIFLGELLPGIDKKSRYFQPIRVDMFSNMYKWIRSYSADVFVYLCMESKTVWQKSFGWSPQSSAELKRLLDDQVR